MPLRTSAVNVTRRLRASSELADGLAAVARSEGPPGGQINVIGNETDRTIAHQHLHTPDVLAPGRPPADGCEPQTGGVAHAVPIRWVRTIIVIVRAAAHFARE